MVRGKERKSKKHADVTQERAARLRSGKPILIRTNPAARYSEKNDVVMENEWVDYPPVPEDDDLIEETPQTTQASQSNWTPGEEPVLNRLASARRELDMDGGDVPMAAANAENPPARGTAKMVTMPMYRTPEYNPFTECRTAKLPCTFYLSINYLNHASPNGNGNPLRIRLNSPYDILKGTTLTKQTVSTTRARGISNDYALFRAGNINQDNAARLIPFPVSIHGPTAATDTESSYGDLTNADSITPAFRPYYFRNWQAWAPLSTNYRVTILNAANQEQDLASVKLFSVKEQYTSNQGESGNLIPTGANVAISDIINWPNVVEHNIDPRNMNTSSSDYVVMEGTWTPNRS